MKVKNKAYIYGVVCIDEEITATDAAIHAAQCQNDTKREEITMIEMTNTIVEPSWKYRIIELRNTTHKIRHLTSTDVKWLRP